MYKPFSISGRSNSDISDLTFQVLMREPLVSIKFRHTDFFDRSISCGGSTSNEGAAGIGANHIAGTPTGADLQGNGSWMLACTDGSSRPFTNADQAALDVLY